MHGDGSGQGVPQQVGSWPDGSGQRPLGQFYHLPHWAAHGEFYGDSGIFGEQSTDSGDVEDSASTNVAD